MKPQGFCNSSMHSHHAHEQTTGCRGWKPAQPIRAGETAVPDDLKALYMAGDPAWHPEVGRKLIERIGKYEAEIRKWQQRAEAVEAQRDEAIRQCFAHVKHQKTMLEWNTDLRAKLTTAIDALKAVDKDLANSRYVKSGPTRKRITAALNATKGEKGQQ